MKSKKILISALCSSVLLGSTVLPAYTAKANSYPVNVVSDEFFSQQSGSCLEEVMDLENLSEQELIDYGNYVKEESANGPTERWKGAVVKKAVKFMVAHADTIPSKTVRDAVKNMVVR